MVANHPGCRTQGGSSCRSGLPQRRGEKSGTGRGPHEGEAGDVELHGACRRALPDEDIDVVVLHGRVKDLLDDVG